MPATAEALKLLRLSPKILTAGAKASGSGGVAGAALEEQRKGAPQGASLKIYLQTLGDHSLRNLLEGGDVVAGDEIIPQAIFLGRGGGGVINRAHNLAQLVVQNFFRERSLGRSKPTL